MGYERCDVGAVLNLAADHLGLRGVDTLEDMARIKRIVVEVAHPQRGSFKTVGCPLKLSDSPVEVTTPPLLGEHTEEILKDIVGFADSEIEEAREKGAI
jgi:formyl-CoA transferase